VRRRLAVEQVFRERHVRLDRNPALHAVEKRPSSTSCLHASNHDPPGRRRSSLAVWRDKQPN
jgi:hypothetical protein